MITQTQNPRFSHINRPHTPLVFASPTKNSRSVVDGTHSSHPRYSFSRRRCRLPTTDQRKNVYNQGRRRLNGRAFRAQREDSVRRTVYVSDIDQNITEEQLAGLFSSCGQVVDCRVCGDPHSILRLIDFYS